MELRTQHELGAPRGCRDDSRSSPTSDKRPQPSGVEVSSESGAAAGDETPEAAEELSKASDAALTAATGNASDGYSFVDRPLRVGDQLQASTKVSARGEINLGVGTGTRNSFDVSVKEVTREEYLEISGELVKKLRLEVTESELMGSFAGTPSSESSPLSGNAYLVAVNGHSLDIERVDGRQLSDAERQDIEERYQYLLPGEQNPDFEDFLPNRPLRLGEKVHVSEEHLAKWMSELSELSETDIDLELTFRRVEPIRGVRCGVFEVSGSARGDIDQFQFRGRLRGQVAIALDGRYATTVNTSGTVELSGPMDGFGGQADVSMLGEYRMLSPK